LVKFVKANFLVGRSFIDDADLDAQCRQWQERVNTERASQASDVTPRARLAEEVAKGGRLPMTASDYAFAAPSRDPHGGSKGVRSTAIWCRPHLPPPTAPKRPSAPSTTLLDRMTQCIDHLVVDVIPLPPIITSMPEAERRTPAA
jgi:hypothetical protein